MAVKTLTTRIKVETDNPLKALELASERLAGGIDEFVLDFSDIHRIGSLELAELEKLAVKGKEKSATIELCGVGIAVYRVLKLANLANGFSFGTDVSDGDE